MDTQFWIWGGVISVVSHALLLAVLFVFDSDGRQKVVEGAIPHQEVSAPVESSTMPNNEQSAKPESSPDPPVQSTREYEVQAGDTLGAIARRVGCSVERLAEVNDSDVRTLSRLRIGQMLVLPE